MMHILFIKGCVFFADKKESPCTSYTGRKPWTRTVSPSRDIGVHQGVVGIYLVVSAVFLTVWVILFAIGYAIGPRRVCADMVEVYRSIHDLLAALTVPVLHDGVPLHVFAASVAYGNISIFGISPIAPCIVRVHRLKANIVIHTCQPPFYLLYHTCLSETRQIIKSVTEFRIHHGFLCKTYFRPDDQFFLVLTYTLFYLFHI